MKLCTYLYVLKLTNTKNWFYLKENYHKETEQPATPIIYLTVDNNYFIWLCQEGFLKLQWLLLDLNCRCTKPCR